MSSPTDAGNGAPVNETMQSNSSAASASTPATLEKDDETIDATSETTQATTPAPSTPKKSDTPRKPRGPTKAQQLATTYQYPLPLRTFPLPTFIPSNPLSLLHLVYAWVSQLVSPPTSHVATYTGTFSPSLRSVHITNPIHIRALWEQGFYGKGSLSRSELSWLDREKRRIGEGASKTSEEVTRQRRAERQQVKWERARVQQEAIEAKRKEEAEKAEGVQAGQGGIKDEVVDAVWGHTKPLVAKVEVAPTRPAQILSMPNSSNEVVDKYTPASSDARAPSPSEPVNTTTIIVDTPAPASSTSPSKTVSFSATTESKTIPSSLATAVPEDAEELPLVIHDKEHLQLTTEEAFFLHYGLGVLNIYTPGTNSPIPTPQLLQQFRRASYFPVLSPNETLKPDDGFLMNYVVYHHFRSLGWVVRGGVKFGVDYLLYNRGPVFSHAEFAVIILPSYSDDYWKDSEPTPEYPSGAKAYADKKLQERGKWSWMHAVNRVNAQVKKTVLLVYVDIPAPLDDEEERKIGIDEMLARYTVREIVLKRWVSNRSRD